MRKVTIIVAFILLVAPMFVAAQVEKQVEVTKSYVPSVGRAEKLSITPDLTDTVRIVPDIDYSVVPLSFATNLTTRPIRPATVTYWEFNRPLPYYVKVGAGYPLNSVVDIYASTQNKNTGYLLGYLNHDGQYAKIRNNFDEKNRSWSMRNRVGIAAGSYVGRHTLEGDLSYDNSIYHRYATIADNDRIMFNDVGAKFRFGDDFTNMSRVNFNVGINGNHLFVAESGSTNQTVLGVNAAAGRAFGRHTLNMKVEYDYFTATNDYSDSRLGAGLKYGYTNDWLRLSVGADYYYNHVGDVTHHYIIPDLAVSLNMGGTRFVPFAEVDGEILNNSFYSLSKVNPYLLPSANLDKSTVRYNLRAGTKGNMFGDKMTYRLYFGAAVIENNRYWLWVGQEVKPEASIVVKNKTNGMLVALARQREVSLNFELGYKPANNFLATLAIHARKFSNSSQYCNGEAQFVANFKGEYTNRKVSFGISAEMQSVRDWTAIHIIYNPDSSYTELYEVEKIPFTVDLGAYFNYRVASKVTLFVEGNNLANARLYNYPMYPEYGANFTIGAKITF